VNYRTKQGDMVDAICHAFYGTTAGITEEVLRLNDELSSHPPVLPAGLLIELPDVEISSEQQNVIRLWD